MRMSQIFLKGVKIMARDPEEFEEEEDYEEEEELTNKQLILAERQEILEIQKEMRKYPRGSAEYQALADMIESHANTIKALEVANNEEQQKYESQQRSESAGSENFFRWATLFAPIVGNIVGTTVGEGIRARARHKDIDTITTYEADGNIVKTAAQKLIK